MILIIGAGISGLSAAKNLKKKFLILERENHIGGLSTQYKSNGYYFDFGGHYFHFKDKPEIKEYLEKFNKFIEFKRKSKVFVLNRYVPYPLQFHLFSLPAGVKIKILHEINHCKTDYFKNLYEFLKNNFGKSLFELFFGPFLTKYYKMDLRNIAANMDRGSIPIPNKNEIIEGLKGKKFSKIGYNPVFYYPKNSLSSFIQNYSLEINKNILLNEEVIEVDLKQKRVKTKNGIFNYEYLINTMPLNNFLKILKQKNEFSSFKNLSHVSTLVLNVVLKEKRKKFHWVYLPEKQFPFYRVGFYPTQKQPVCYLEKTIKIKDSLNKDLIYKKMEFTLKKLKLIKSKNEIVYFDAKSIPVSYVIFDHKWKDNVPSLLERLKNHNIFSTGRYGAWNYTSMSDDVKSAIKIARILNSTR